jgi:hypothetical protein
MATSGKLADIFKFLGNQSALGRFEPIACRESSRSRRMLEQLVRGCRWYVK